MDVSSVSNSTGQTQMPLQISLAVTKKAMDNVRQNGQALVNLMERSVNPNLGGKLDIKV